MGGAQVVRFINTGNLCEFSFCITQTLDLNFLRIWQRDHNIAYVLFEMIKICHALWWKGGLLEGNWALVLMELWKRYALIAG